MKFLRTTEASKLNQLRYSARFRRHDRQAQCRERNGRSGAEEASKTLGLPRVPQNRKEGHDNASTKKQKTTDVIAVISLEPALWQIPF